MANMKDVTEDSVYRAFVIKMNHQALRNKRYVTVSVPPTLYTQVNAATKG